MKFLSGSLDYGLTRIGVNADEHGLLKKSV